MNRSPIDNSLPEIISNSRDLLEAFAAGVVSNIRIAIIDKNCKIVYVNERFCKLTQYRPDDLVGKVLSHLRIISHNKEFFEEVYSVISQGIKWSGEINSISRDGTPFWVRTDILPISIDGQAIESFLVFCSDITATKRAMDAKEEAMLKLQQSEERYRILVENQSDLISLCDANGNRIYVNTRYCKFIGKRYDELIGTNIHTLTLSGLSPLISRINELSPQNSEISGICQLFDAFCTPFWIDLRVKGIFDSEGNLFEILTIGRNVTALKNAELHKTNYIEDLERMAFMTSHNVRAPIATMLGFIELLRLNAIGSDQWHDIFDHFKKCINDLDFYTRELALFINQRQSFDQ